MKLNAKSAIIPGAILAVAAIIYGSCRLARTMRANAHPLGDCRDHEYSKCPTEGLCGLNKDEK